MANINNLYVGGFFMPTKLSNNTKYSDEDLINLFKIKKMTSYSSVIKAVESDYLLTDWREGVNYTPLITLFEKKEDYYIALYDDSIFRSDSIKMSIPFTSILPKVDFELASEISYKHALLLFEYIFKKNYLFPLKTAEYKNTKFDINKFFVGHLHFKNGNFDEFENYEFSNFIIKQMLIHNGLSIKQYKTPDKVDFIQVKGLWLDVDSKMLFLHNNTFYETGINRGMESVLLNDNGYYDWMIPFNEFVTDSSLSIKEAIKVYKKNRI